MGHMTVVRAQGPSLTNVASEDTVRTALHEDAANASSPHCIEVLPEPRPYGAAALLVGVNGQQGVLWWSHPEQRESLLAVGGSNAEIVLYTFGSEETDFPPHTELPIGTVVEAVTEFVRTGQRPTGVEWLSDDVAWDRYLAEARQARS